MLAPPPLTHQVALPPLTQHSRCLAFLPLTSPHPPHRVQCGAHARSLQYFETHVRSVHGGALNPAAYRSATYDDAEVSYLQASRQLGVQPACMRTCLPAWSLVLH